MTILYESSTLIYNLYIYLKFYNFLLNKGFKKFEKKKFLLEYSKNDFFILKINHISCNYSFFNKIINKYVFKKLTFILSNLFYLNKNLLFVDVDTNYNYLPIKNDVLFNRSFSKLPKLIKYFDIALIFYINLKKKKFIFKKLYNCNLINVSLTSELVDSKFDFSLPFKDKLSIYVFYLFVLNFYIKVKNKI